MEVLCLRLVLNEPRQLTQMLVVSWHSLVRDQFVTISCLGPGSLNLFSSWQPFEPPTSFRVPRP